MERFLSEIKRKLSRLFFGRIVVRDLGALHREESAEIRSHFRDISVNVLRAAPRVGAALFVKWRTTIPISAGSLMGAFQLGDFKVHSVYPFSAAECRVARYKLNIRIRASARAGLRRMKKTPLSRRNRLAFLKTPPKFEKSSLLALFSPIYRDKVVKSILDKTSGNLLFWYDYDRVKAGEKYHLVLLRVFGDKDPLKWVWLPANKTIS